MNRLYRPTVELLESRWVLDGLPVADPLPHHVSGAFYMRLLPSGYVSYPKDNLPAFGLPAIEQHAPAGAVLPVAPKGMPQLHTPPGVDAYSHPEAVVLDHIALVDLGMVRTAGGISYLQPQADGLHAFFASAGDETVIELLLPAAWRHPDGLEPALPYTGF